MKKGKMNNLYAGIYATSPSINKWNEAEEFDFYEKIKEALPQIAGLELPFYGETFHSHDESFFLKNASTNWNYILTCIPGNMSYLSEDSHFGLASDNEESRKKAVDFYKSARLAVKRLNSYFGRKTVTAVQFATSPSQQKNEASSSKGALYSSLLELSALDWFGAKLNLEHCDALQVKHSPEKGFLSLEDEIEVLSKLQNQHTPLGIILNWGRSFLETRSVEGPINHIKMTKEAGLLRGVIFSGATDKQCAYGPFSDSHMPFSKEPYTTFYENLSLLTEKETTRCLEIAEYNSLEYIGIKVLAMPLDGPSIDRRVGLNYDGIQVLTRAVQACN